MTAKRPSGGQRTAAARQESLRERRERQGLRRLEVWVPDGSQEMIRQVVVEAIYKWRRPKMYDQEKLARAIEMACDAAYEEDADYDVRHTGDRGLYIVLREHEDGGRVLWSTDRGTGAYAEDIAARILEEETERSELERG